ncbi:MAG: 5-formyltetrahydrofolate cyclo-ligase [Proteobacteria bacterium]|nr:5-formyltetrahydrofolate cyclo-ligase [Pseudomonadota bacterium]
MPIPDDEKTALRAALRRRRRALAAEGQDAATRAAAALPQDLLGRFAVVGGYHAVGAEMDPGPLLARLAAAGAAIALPAARPGEPLDFRLAQPGETPEPDAFGIPSPPASAPAARPDLVIAPVLAFDRQGGRLGQGGGHYDRTLEALRAAGPVFVLGLAYAGQEVAQAPMASHDQRLDAILTERGYIGVRKDF